MTASEKRNFRATQKWKKFRQFLIRESNSSCSLCDTHYVGARKKMLQIHHLDPDNYTDLNPAKFKPLCSSCHDLVEKWVTKICGKNWEEPDNWGAWFSLLSDFLPYYVLNIIKEKKSSKEQKAS